MMLKKVNVMVHLSLKWRKRWNIIFLEILILKSLIIHEEKLELY